MKNNQQVKRMQHICPEIDTGRLEALRNRYRGKRCFILGNGPSLNKIDLSKLKDEITFGMDEIYLTFSTIGFFPTFYVCIDHALMQLLHADIVKIPSTKFHDISQFNPNSISPTTIFLEKNLSGEKFFTDLRKGYNPGASTAFVVMQLAFHMGFSQIFLVGFDHDIPDTTIEDSFQLAKGICEWEGRIIIDATFGGKLTVFPKIEFADIFCNPHTVPAAGNFYRSENDDKLSVSGIQHEYIVSAIVSTYNSERYMRECLDDLLRQTIADRLEIIVINSCSQQNEEAIVYEYMARHPNIVYVKTATRESIYKAWNRGIRLARGKYITNANTDDAHALDAYEKMAAVLDANQDIGLVYVNQKYYRELEGGKKEFWFDCDRGPFSWNRLLDECFASSQPMWRACVHDEFGYFDEIFYTAGDYEYWLRIAQKYRFYHLKEVLGVRLIRNDSLEYAGNSFLSWLETAFLQKCYEYASLYSLSVGPEGLGGHPVFSRWPEIHMLRRNTLMKINSAAHENQEQVFDWRTPRLSPKVSVIITTFNRQNELLENLNLLNVQSFVNFEVIIVNNGESVDVLKNGILKLLYNYCYIESSCNYGPSYARNLGVQLSAGEIVAILDDDAIADKDWILNITRHFDEENIIALRGKVLLKTNEGKKHIPLNYDLGDVSIASTVGLEMNTAFKRDAFITVGGYDELLFGFEGAELSYRLFCNYGKRIDCIKYYPDVLIYHDFPEKPERLTETVLRLKAMRKALQKKSPGLEDYIGFMWRMMPSNQKWEDPAWLSDNAVFCLSCDPVKADDFATAAMRLVPNEPVPYLVRGQALGILNKLEDAVPMFGKAIELLDRLRAKYLQAGRDCPPDLQHLITVAETGLHGCRESTELLHAQQQPVVPPPQPDRKVLILQRSAMRMKQYQDIHAGQRCVIIGNGPSLNKMDLSFLEQEICFGMNRIYLIFDKWKFRPTYYVSVNPLVIEQSADDILALPMPKFLSHKGINFVKDPRDIMFIAEHPQWEFSTTPYAGLHEGWTVTYVAMQLAYFMGFSEVVLIGVDHHFVTPGDPNKEVISQGDDPNHFHPDYFGKGMRWHLPDLERSERSYNLAKNAYESSGRIIVDATLDGKLTIFPKVDYKDYFSDSPQLQLSTLATLFSECPSKAVGKRLTGLLRSLGYHSDAELVLRACQSL
ncbi:glycosyltransferase [Trichlorobacter ammonificans]|uniref:TPR_REGION domain-containing protein n=1 Tax=Trichlorobacter ammonificans TaxID=2916410 RepID=A0ABM9D670_9BACT|nr:glycosyltransferase [Trichlorobacter ammonificans]CAH2029929.1 TPR_REGION domain-containing protein [Trichlorobacter ammonificans]